MDNIMKRFKSFTTVMQNNSSTDDDDKDEEDDDDENGNEPDGEGQSRPRASSEDKVIEVTLPETEVIDSEFANSGFWKTSIVADDDLDDLLKDYE